MNIPEGKTVRVDIFDIPESEVEVFTANRELCATAVTEVMRPYCAKVVRETLDVEEGEAIVGYYKTGEVLLTVLLDPFEVPVMKMAYDTGKLKDYVLAANGVTEPILQALLEEDL